MKIEKPPTVIVAYDLEGGIGLNGELPWAGKVPVDMKHFKETTTGNRVVMGRVTYDSIGEPLTGRENYVLSKNTKLQIPGCRIINNAREALYLDDEDPRQIFVIGGAKIYELYMPFADRLIITRVEATFKSDSFFIGFDEANWRQINRKEVPADDFNDYDCTFLEYERLK